MPAVVRVIPEPLLKEWPTSTRYVRIKKTAAIALATALLSTGPAVLAQEPAIEDVSTGDAVVGLASDRLPAVEQGVDEWLLINWVNTGQLSAREFFVTDNGSTGLELLFPDYSDDKYDMPYFPADDQYTSLWSDDSLETGEMDQTSLRVTAISSEPVLRLRVSYVSDVGTATQDLELPLEIAPSTYDGEGMGIDAGSIGPISADSVAWKEVGFGALANVRDVQVRVLSDAFDIVYPGDAEYSQPSGGSGMAQETSDYAGVRFDSTGLAPGEYPVTIELTFVVRGQTMVVSQDTLVVVEAGPTDDGPTDDGPTDDGPTDVTTGYSSIDNPGVWTVNPFGTDTATTGQWELGGSERIVWNGFVTQLASTPSGADALFTTGSFTGTVGDDDVDDGVTTILSPEIQLAGGDVQLSMYYYLAYLSNSSRDDYLRVTVIGEDGEQVILEERGAASYKDAAWKPVTVDLGAFAGQTIRLLVEAADASDPSLVEAAVADIVIS